MISTDQFPPELCSIAQWLVWRFEPNEANPDKPRKVPYYTNGRRRTGTQGSDDDRSKLTDAESAIRYADAKGFDGVGFAFLPNDGLIGIDLDGCFNTDDNEKHERALRIIKACNSYTELSPSGNGVHIIVKGTCETFKSNLLGIEVFCGRQFFTMTGRLRAGSSLNLNPIPDPTIDKLRRTVKEHSKPDPEASNKPRYKLPAEASKIEEAILFINPDCGYDDWIRIGMAIHSELHDSGFMVWDAWSSQSSKYPGEKELRSHWKSFGRGSGITIGTLFGMAKDAGWKPTRPHVHYDIPPNYNPKIDPETGEILEEAPERMILLDLKNPLDIAKIYVAMQATIDTTRTLHRWRGDFYAWNGIHYAIIDDERIRARLYDWLASCFNEVKGVPEPVKPNIALVREVNQALMAETRIDIESAPEWLIPPEDMTPASDIIPCWNGFFRISTRKLEPARPELFITAALEFDAKENPEQPNQWFDFLESIWDHDPAAIYAFQESMGYMLTDQTEQQKAFMICGPRRSGKGTLLRVLEALVGKSNKVSPSLSSLGSDFGLQPLIGKRVAMISDARLSIRADQAAITENILRITGEDTVSVARKHRENWDGKLPTRFIFATNELPHFNDTSSALAGRFVMFQLIKTFYGKEDVELTDKLKAELPGILMWALDGLERLRKIGRLTQTESGKMLVREMEELTSPVSMFVEEECILDPDASIPCHELFAKWQSWCDENGRSHPGASNTFSRNLKATFTGIDTHKPTSASKRNFRGIRLATDLDRYDSA